jgi:Na+-translocating ferredoxin:NAD+ oxidoreductase subunit C
MRPIDIASEQQILPIKAVTEYLKPDKIYLKVPDLNCLIVKKGEKILKEQTIYQNANTIITSPVSGIVDISIQIDDKLYVIINNDYQENSQKLGHAHNLGKMSKETFLNYLNDDKIKAILTSNLNNLYINAIDMEPYFYNKYAYLKNNLVKVLELVKNIVNIFNIDKVTILITNNCQDLIDDYQKIVSEYNKISMQVVPNIYPIGNEIILTKYLKLTTHEGLLDLNDLITIDYQVRKNRSISETYLTINGNMIKGQVFKVKIGTFLPVILNQMGIKDEKLILNNSLCGHIIDKNKTIIDCSIKGIIINEEENIKEDSCNNCGMCYEACPLKINPLIKNVNCLKCGLCNYVCPAKINIVERIQEKND